MDIIEKQVDKALTESIIPNFDFVLQPYEQKEGKLIVNKNIVELFQEEIKAVNNKIILRSKTINE